MRNSTAVSSVRPGRAVSQADARAPAQLLKRAMSTRAAAWSWDACPAASASGIADTARICVCMCHWMLKAGNLQSRFALTAASRLPRVIRTAGNAFH